MLKTLKLHNFRTYLNAELSFTRHHLVIGPNNSGKTNLCAALAFLRTSTSGDLATAALEIPGGIPEFKNWAFDSNSVELSCVCELLHSGQPHLYTYELSLNVESSGSLGQTTPLALRVVHEQLVMETGASGRVTLLESDGRKARILTESSARSSDGPHMVDAIAPNDATMLSKMYDAEGSPYALQFRRYLSNWAVYTLSPYAMRMLPSGPPRPAGLSTLGENLASVLYHLKNIAEHRYRRVIEHVQLIEPHLEAINFIPVPDQGAYPVVALRNNPRASWVGLSDGTLRCLALACIVEMASTAPDPGSQANPLAIIEEPENGIYPGQLRAFFDVFEDKCPAGQFLFTSHSPYFINFFDARRDSVTLLRRKNERTETVRIPPADNADPERPMLAEQYSMELLD